MSFIKKTTVKLSLITMMALTPSMVMGASGSGFMEGSSESTSAMLETPTFEGQIARINIGINLIRLNTDILERMPISADAQWVDKIILPFTSKIRRATLKSKAMREDAYYSTVTLTNHILGRRAISISPLTARLFYEASVIYKNSTNGYNDFHIPDMNVFPDISDMKTYITFKDDAKVAVIDVEAKTGLFPNVVDATISLLPEDLVENIQDARKEMQNAKDEFNSKVSEVGSLEAWLDDDKNDKNPQKEEKSKLLDEAKDAKDNLKKVFEEKSDIYFELLESGAEAIASNFDDSKIPLAQKLKKLLDAIDNNAMGAISMFTSATAGLTRGMGALKNDMKAIATAQSLSNLVGNQKKFLAQRYKRIMVGALMAIPNISIGSYMAISQSNEIGKYQDIVNKILEGAEAEKDVKTESIKDK